MKSYGIVGAALYAVTAVAVSRNILARNNYDDFDSFAQNLGLSGSDRQVLVNKLTQDTNTTSSNVLGVACLTAQKSIGAAQVNTAPLNETVVDENWSQSCVSQPYCIIQPSETSEVSRAIQIIDYFQVKFAVRSGGHSPNPGWSSIGSEGILIDLQRFDEVSLSKDGKVASVGPGRRWGEVTSILSPQGATVIGGRLPDVGVPGLILGGGYHFLSGQYGLAADNVKNFEIVLANGTISNANATSNRDLFWALKGGGPNFGIVTRFDLSTVPVNQIWGQMAIYSPDQADDVLDAFAQWQTDGASDLKSTVNLILGLDQIIVGLIYSEPADLPGAFGPFYNLTALQTIVPGTNTTFVFIDQILSSAFPNVAERHDYRGVSSRIDAQLDKDVYSFWHEKAVAVKEATGANQTFAIQHVPKNLAQQGIAKGGNPLNLSLEDQQWWTTIIDWVDEEDDDQVRSVSIDTANQWGELSKERGLDVSFVFMNDASRDENPLATYGSENVNKLKAISQKYDKKQLFQKLQNNGFLLSKV